MATVEESRCPKCGAPPGSLELGEVIVPRPIGTFSLSGSTMKVSAHAAPVLRCTGCGLHIVGRYNGRHVEFKPPEAKELPKGWAQ